MITVILFALIGVGIGIFNILKERNRTYKPGIGESIFFCGVTAFVGASIGMACALVITLALPKEMVLTDSVEIVAINDGSRVQGSFFLGSGHINEQPYYFFYAKTGNGGYTQQRARASEAVVYENDEVKPRADRYSLEVVEKWQWLSLHGCDCGYRTDIFIPSGSIVRDFSLDLE